MYYFAFFFFSVDKCELLLPDGENVLDTSKEHIVNVPINETHVQGKAPIAIVAPVEANKSVSIIGDQFSKLIRLSTSKPNEIQFFFQKDAVTEFLGKVCQITTSCQFEHEN